MTYRAYGKQIKRDGEHIADAASETYAQIIADALNDRLTDPLRYMISNPAVVIDPKRYFPIPVQLDPTMPPDTMRMRGADYATKPDQQVWGRNDGHIWQRQQDEYACTCGARWDVSDGECHP